MATAVANRYARALVDAILAAGSPLPADEAVQQLRAVDQMIGESAELRTALLTPAIPNSKKRAVMARLLAQSAPMIRNFVFVLIDHRRVGMIEEIREAFEQHLDERRGFVRAEVTSAEPLDAQRNSQVETALSQLTGKRMRLRFAVNPELLGGATARIGSTVFDGSLRGQLRQLKKNLTESAVAE